MVLHHTVDMWVHAKMYRPCSYSENSIYESKDLMIPTCVCLGE